MNSRRLVLRSLRHHARTHLGGLLTAGLVAAVITAALGVGDSVRSAMDRVAAARVGNARFAAHAPGRLWRAELAERLAYELDTTVSASLQLNGTVARPDGTARIHGARVLGVDDAFWALSPGGRPPLEAWPRDGAAISTTVAERLGVSVGDRIVLRVESPSDLPRETALTPEDDVTDQLMVEVAAVLDSESFAAFSLRIGPVAPVNVFLPLARLQEAVEEEGRANTLLAADRPDFQTRLGTALRRNISIDDAGLSIHFGPEDGGLELRSRRVFIEDAVAAGALGIDGASGVLTWFVNELRVGDRRTPYSMVAALPPDGGLIPEDLGDDEIIVNEWLAADLKSRAGDRITLTFFALAGPGGLVERSAEFRIRTVVPIEGLAADPSLMPAFPGISESEDCRDWDPGFHIDLDRVRDRDEAYWDEHRGTPKAFVSLRAGQRQWGNRFGKLTAVRYPPSSVPTSLAAVLQSRLDPAALGLTFTDLRSAEAAARSEGMDFGALFLGFSGFLVLAALLLMGLVVALNVAMRQRELATLLALGFGPGRAFRLFALEHGIVALGGGVAGVAGGIALEAAALAALGTVWSDVAGSLPIEAVVRPATLVAGALGGAAVSLLAAGIVLRRAIRRSVREAFVRSEECAVRAGRSPVSGWAALGLAVAAVVLALTAGTGRDPATAGAFFGSGALLLAAGLSSAWWALGRIGGARRPSLRGLAWRNLGRRRGRSVTTIGVLAFGVFMFLGVTVFRRDRLETAEEKTSGTGGFELVGESAVAVLSDLHTPDGSRIHPFAENDLSGAWIVGLRVRAGDDASCTNLTRAQAPEIVGVNPGALTGRFTFVQVAGEFDDPWRALDEDLGDGIVPAVIDQATFWTLGRGLGDDVDLTDEAGRPFAARIVGVIDNAVLHGHLVISSFEFIDRFPSHSGYRKFLIDVSPPSRTDEIAALLSRQLDNRGLALERAELRLNSLNAVENTYLGIFQALGGIGLLLGSVGLALVVGRNILERRAELALLGAVGLNPRRIAGLVTTEHVLLLAAGLAVGVAASIVALLPVLLAPGARILTPGIGAVLAGLALGGVLWTRIAVRMALRGRLVSNLREE